MGIVPLGIGLTVLGFLWLSPFRQFGSPPLFFRIFGSFIALAFVLHGIALVSGKLTDPHQLKSMLSRLRESQGIDTTSPSDAGYACPYCNAPLDASANVSPHGDALCGHCGKWFNVHGRRA